MVKKQGLNPKSLGLSIGCLWGLCMLVFGAMAANGFAMSAYQLLGTIYIGISTSLLGIILCAIYGFIDGFIGGWLIAWFYNYFES